ncbi:MAG: hypothetical protein SGVNAXEH_000268 [Holophagaceae bacterium]|jgi:uncharacterized protein YebE (UPF0316 family)
MQLLDTMTDVIKRFTGFIWVVLTIAILLEVLGLPMANLTPVKNLLTLSQGFNTGLVGILAAFIAWNMATRNN